MKFLSVLLAAALFLGTDAGAKTVDLSAFYGNYKGKGTVLANGKMYDLNGKAKFKVAKTGRSGLVTLSGVIMAEGGRRIPWGTTLVLKKSGKLTTSNVEAVDFGGKTYTAKGTYKVPNRSRVVGNASVKVGTSTGLQNVELEVAPKGNKKELEISLIFKVNGKTNYVFDVEMTGR